MDKEYVIKEKYCPSRKMNVPVMVFSDASLNSRCWDSDVCSENCCYSKNDAQKQTAESVKVNNFTE